MSQCLLSRYHFGNNVNRSTSFPHGTANTKCHLISLLVVLAFVFLLNGCGPSKIRNPLPEEFSGIPNINGIPLARTWGDEPPEFQKELLSMSVAELKNKYPTVADKSVAILAISGGGSNGAYGAGLLAGWSKKGTRPDFFAVTGISAGALIAPFAFLGPEYDGALQDIWTSHSTKDMLKKRSFLNFINNDALGDSIPLSKLIKKYLSKDMIDKIGREYKEKGRELLIGTTDLDSMRPMIWSIGKIAMSHYPQKEELIYDILLASASIPGVFPPVYVKVNVGDSTYDELHVDGGTSSQVFVSPPGIRWDMLTKKLNIHGKPKLYIIRNAKIKHDWEIVKPSIESIAIRSISSLTHSQGLGDLSYIYLNALYDNLDYNLSYIGSDFKKEEKEIFDKEYMKALFIYGQNQMQKNKAWVHKPPRSRFRQAIDSEQIFYR